VIRAEQRLRVTRRRKSQVRMIDVKKREVDMIDRYLGILGSPFSRDDAKPTGLVVRNLSTIS
jgi:hypothetical protein